jgi:preprotein translocase subunit SecG
MTALLRFGLGFLLVFSALFLIALVLIQRGRGGGLAGAFGGAGGQSAFGTKAGDVFTRITVVVAACWILLCILAINLLGRRESLFNPTLGAAAGQAVPAQSTLPPADGSVTPAPGEAAPTQPATPASAPAASNAPAAAATAAPAAAATAAPAPAEVAPAAAPTAESPADPGAK